MQPRILFADPSAITQKMVEQVMAERGIQVVAAPDGELAQDLIDRLRPDLVIAEASLPAKSGYELCKYIKSRRELRNIPTVVTASLFERTGELKARVVGADAYLSKPFDSRALLNTVLRLLPSLQGRQKPVEPRLARVNLIKQPAAAPRKPTAAAAAPPRPNAPAPPPKPTASARSLAVVPVSRQVSRQPRRAPKSHRGLILASMLLLLMIAIAAWVLLRAPEAPLPVAEKVTREASPQALPADDQAAEAEPSAAGEQPTSPAPQTNEAASSDGATHDGAAQGEAPRARSQASAITEPGGRANRRRNRYIFRARSDRPIRRETVAQRRPSLAAPAAVEKRPSSQAQPPAADRPAPRPSAQEPREAIVAAQAGETASRTSPGREMKRAGGAFKQAGQQAGKGVKHLGNGMKEAVVWSGKKTGRGLKRFGSLIKKTVVGW